MSDLEGQYFKRILELESKLAECEKVIEDRGYAFQEAINKALAERDRYRVALQNICSILGPTIPDCCVGARIEMSGALEYAREALSNSEDTL